MRIIVNALSVTNASGTHVLLGHLQRVAQWMDGEHHFLVLHHAANRNLVRDLGGNVEWIECPPSTRHWSVRAMWERGELSRLARRVAADRVFTPSGTVVPGLNLPQVSFAQNPWSLVPGLMRTPTERLKAWLQRNAYRVAMEQARVMVFNSEYMRGAYRANAGGRERGRSEVVYQAIDDATHEAAAAARDVAVRRPNAILTVSVMAPHKGVETVVAALALVRQGGVPAELQLAGAWPDRGYERRIRSLVSELGLEDAVHILGHVPSDTLHRLYAEARVFCLMSRCESFGIPAVEAQAFGTPVVSSLCCAIPEVCGAGGRYTAPGNVAGVAQALLDLLTDDRAWRGLSSSARANAARFRWDECSRPLAAALVA
jgi:glycosyltransferase involved in cell wall biosynthesis